MDHEILDDMSWADVAFRVRGNNPEELFSAGARALVAIILQHPETVRPSITVSLTCTSKDIDLLYFDFLSELIYYKDSEKLLLMPDRLIISSSSDGYTLSCSLLGERIDRERHIFNIDVKAITLHNLLVEKENGTWSATAVVDV